MSLEKVFNRKDIPIYPWYIADLVATKEIGQVTHGLIIKGLSFYSVNGLTNMCYERKSTDVLGSWLLKRIVNNKKFYHLVIRKIYYYSKRLMDFCQELKNLSLEKMSDQKLLQIYAEYKKKLGDLRIWGWVPPFLDGVFTPFLSDYIMADFSKFLKKEGQADKVASYYSLFSSSEKMSEVQIENLERLKLLLKIKKGKVGEKVLASICHEEIMDFRKNFPFAKVLMDKHLNKFGWLTYAYAGPVMNFEYLFKTLSADLKNGDILSQIKKITDHFCLIIKEKKDLQKELKLPTKLIYLFEVSSELMFIKDYRKGIYQKSYVAMDKIMEELANRLNLSFLEIRFLVLDEIKDALLNNQKKIYRSRAKQRIKKCYYSVSEGKITVYEGDKADKLIAKIEKDNKSKPIKIKELKGSIGYAGLVRGIVKIILTKNDVPKLKTGDVLVSSATNPDLISAMKKAIAFVTDSGGIICHAAIVARELKKPCVIGTKIATKVLKDGDLVEVDANKGIVRIIK
jgi:phosphoenolpyruvate synthase/pyruvate phosphate dikinase